MSLQSKDNTQTSPRGLMEGRDGSGKGNGRLINSIILWECLHFLFSLSCTSTCSTEDSQVFLFSEQTVMLFCRCDFKQNVTYKLKKDPRTWVDLLHPANAGTEKNKFDLQ